MKPTTIAAVRVRKPERPEQARRRAKNGRGVRSALIRRRDVVTDAFDDRVHDARRSALKARFLTEDAVDIATILLRRHPIRSVGMAFVAGAGLALGARRLFG